MAAAARMWPGIHAHVVFANVDSTFDAAQPNVREATGSALSRRAASILHPSGFVVAYEDACCHQAKPALFGAFSLGGCVETA